MAEYKDKIQEKYDFFLGMIGHGHSSISEVESLVGLTGIKPSEEILKKNYIKALDVCLSEHERDSLREFSKKYGISKLVSEDEIQDVYTKQLKEANFNRLKDAANVTGIKPELDEELLQRAYLKTFQSSNGVQNVSIFERFSGVKAKIPEDIIKAKYMEFILNRGFYLDHFEKLRDFSDVEPNIPFDVVQDKYKSFLEDENWDYARQLRNFLNVDFSEDIVLDLHAPLVEEGSYGTICRLWETTNIPPGENLVQAKYLSLMDKEDFLEASNLKRSLEVNPQISEKKVQEIYSRISGSYFVMKAENVMELTGIAPDEVNIQRGYQLLIEGNNFGSIARLQELTGVEPSRKTLKSLEDYLKE